MAEIGGFVSQSPFQILFCQGTGFAGAGGGAIEGEGLQGNQIRKYELRFLKASSKNYEFGRWLRKRNYHPPLW